MKIHRFYPLKEKDMFDCEYWSLEQAKLGRVHHQYFRSHCSCDRRCWNYWPCYCKEFSKLGANILLVDQDLDALETAVKQLTTFDKIIVDIY